MNKIVHADTDVGTLYFATNVMLMKNKSIILINYFFFLLEQGEGEFFWSFLKILLPEVCKFDRLDRLLI